MDQTHKPIDVIALGRIAVDLNPEQKNCSMVENQRFTKYVGGSPANIAVGLARLGKRVGFLGMVSQDRLGEYVLHYFRQEGIDTSHIALAQHGEKLGLAFTEVLSPTQSSILMYRDGVADLSLSPQDIDEGYIQSAKALLVSGTALCASPSREAALKAAEYARKHGVTLVFDIDYRAYTWKSLDEVTLYYSLMGRQSDIILGSREEFDLMERLMLDGPGGDARSAALWHGLGAQLLVIKHGKEGSAAYARSGETYQVKPYPVTLLKSFGGGDGYASALLSGLLEGWPLERALALGSASASMLVAAESCSHAMPTLEQIQAFMSRSGMEIHQIVRPV